MSSPTPEPVRPEPVHAEPVHAEPVHAEPVRTCASCGTTPSPTERWRWTTGVSRGGQPQIVCPDCAREHARSFEAGLDDV